MVDIAIRAEGLRKSYGTEPAVKGLSLTVYRGEMFALVGPDGAGKTTVIRMLCGILTPSDGSAAVAGFDVVRDRGNLVRHIGYLSQKFSLYGDLTVDENIEFFAEIHGVRGFEKRREELLGYLQLSDFRTRYADRLSGGMKQKLALACTLVHTPDVLFLDEPTTGVDPVSRREFWLILSDLLKDGMTIVLTTPYLDEAERCSRVGLMHEGELMVADSPAAIRNMMIGTLVEVVCERPREAARLLRGIAGVRETQIFGDRTHLVVDDFSVMRTRIEAVLSAHRIGLVSVRAAAPSLENVFISLVEAPRP
jgi:ABC-2 type transport system ATP-binding protein